MPPQCVCPAGVPSFLPRIDTAAVMPSPAQRMALTDRRRGGKGSRRDGHSAPPPELLVGFSIGMERGCQQNDRTLADGAGGKGNCAGGRAAGVRPQVRT